MKKRTKSAAYVPKRLSGGAAAAAKPQKSWRGKLGWICLGLYPLFCLIVLNYFNFKAIYTALGRTDRMFLLLLQHLRDNPRKVLFELLVLYLLAGILLLLVRRGWIAALILGAVSLCFSYIQYMKLLLNGDPFMPSDFALAGQAGEVAGMVSIPIPRLFWVGVAAALLWCGLLLWTGAALPLRWYFRLPGAGLLCAGLVLFSFHSTAVAKVLTCFGMSLSDCAQQVDNYTTNGFVGGFTLNLLSQHVEKPQGYSEETVTELLADCEIVPSDEDYEDFDVILVLSESFFDPRELEGVTFSEDILENYDALLQSENCYSGSIYTSALGGGTVRTEFEILTGLSTEALPGGAVPYIYVKHDLEGYVSNYKSAGYNALALHLYDESFYSRDKGYPYLGFDDYYGLEDVMEDMDVSFTRTRATDTSTEQAIEYYLEQAGENGNPTFLFAITIENHQPYGENENNTVTVTAPALDEDQLLALTTYTQGVKDADEMLGALRDYIDNRERPTILVWFGDHKPTLGSIHTTFEALGYYDSDDLSTENRMKMFSTPFLVYSNRELEQGLFSGHTDNEIADYYLLECVAVSSGFQQSSYMSYLRNAFELLPVYSSRLNLSDSLTEAQKALVQGQKTITYDRMVGKRYSQSGD